MRPQMPPRAHSPSGRRRAPINVKLAANMLREAAAITTQITGETIPSDKPACLAMTVRQPAGVVLASHRGSVPNFLNGRHPRALPALVFSFKFSPMCS